MLPHKSMTLVLFASLLSFTITPGLAQERGARGRNSRIFVVPAPEGVKIDGDLADWDKSGGIDVFVTAETRAMRSVRVYAMYDAEAFYLAGEVADRTPMMNVHDPATDIARAWDADAFQFRMYLKPTYPGRDSVWDVSEPKYDSVHMLLYYYTPKELPVLQLAYGMKYSPPKAGWKDGLVPADKFQGAYKKYPDGSGYTFEYRIPWSTLSDEYRLKAGDLTAAAIQAQWGTPDGRTSEPGGWAMDLMSRAGFSFQTSACWGKAIFSEQGNLPADLTQEGLPPVPPMPLTFRYKLPTNAMVTVALVDTNGAPVRHIVTGQPRPAGEVVELWDGLDDKGDPLPAGTYQFKGIYYDPLKVEYKLSVHNAGQPGYPTADGTGGWGGDHGAPSAVAGNAQQMVLGWNACECGWGLIGTDLTGKKRWGTKTWTYFVTVDDQYAYVFGGIHGQVGIQRLRLRDGATVKFADTRPMADLPADVVAGVSGLVVIGDHLYAACPGWTKREFSTWSSQHKEVPADFNRKNRIVVLNKADGALVRDIVLAEKADQGQPQLGGIAKRSDTELYAIYGGKIVIIDLATGKLREFAGTNLDAPAALAVDTAGNVYASNYGKRMNVSVFDPTGKYLRSIGKPGGRPTLGKWDGRGMLNPGAIFVDALDRLWVAEEDHAPKRFSVWDTKTGKLLKEFFGGSHYSTFVSMDPVDPTRVYCHAVQWKVDLDKGTSAPEAIVLDGTHGAVRFVPFTAKNGRQYAFAREDGLTLAIRDRDRFKRLAWVGGYNGLSGEAWYHDWVLQFKDAQGNLPHPLNLQFLWQDRNNDGLKQTNELQQVTFLVGFWGGWVDSELRLCSGGNYHDMTAYVLEPTRIDRAGKPTYDATAVRRIGPGKIMNTEFSHAMIDAEEQAIYVAGGGHLDARLGGGKVYPGFNKYSLVDGRHLWGYWKAEPSWVTALAYAVPKVGEAYGNHVILGRAGDFVAVCEYFGSINLWTTDGLYVAKIYNDQRLGVMGPDTINAEFFGGHFVKTKAGRYFILAGDSDGRVNELIGLQSARRFSGTYTLTADDVAKAEQERAAFAIQKTRVQQLVVHRLEGLNWEEAKGIEKRVDNRRGFRVALAYDNQHLVARYDVDSPYELVNGITEPQLLFKGGNCLDIELQSDTGPVRLIITRQHGTPVCTAYFKNGDGRVTLESPTGKEVFARIESIPVEMQYEKTTGGFIATVRIPLAKIGLTLKPAMVLKLDVGYRFGNETGTVCAQRAYWSNTSALSAIIYDVPSETRMEPDNWGTATIE